MVTDIRKRSVTKNSHKILFTNFGWRCRPGWRHYRYNRYCQGGHPCSCCGGERRQGRRVTEVVESA